jgi:hypothetical protein
VWAEPRTGARRECHRRAKLLLSRRVAKPPSGLRRVLGSARSVRFGSAGASPSRVVNDFGGLGAYLGFPEPSGAIKFWLICEYRLTARLMMIVSRIPLQGSRRRVTWRLRSSSRQFYPHIQ